MPDPGDDWSLIWRIPVALALAVVVLACYALDDLIRAARRLLNHWR